MKVKILTYREYRKNTLCGFCEISVNGLKIKDCTHHRKDDSAWISFPSKGYELNGQTKWRNLLEWQDKADAWEFQDACKDALKRYFAREEAIKAG